MLLPPCRRCCHAATTALPPSCCRAAAKLTRPPPCYCRRCQAPATNMLNQSWRCCRQAAATLPAALLPLLTPRCHQAAATTTKLATTAALPLGSGGNLVAVAAAAAWQQRSGGSIGDGSRVDKDGSTALFLVVCCELSPCSRHKIVSHKPR
jgi:hypothetical protein